MSVGKSRRYGWWWMRAAWRSAFWPRRAPVLSFLDGHVTAEQYGRDLDLTLQNRLRAQSAARRV